MSAGDKPVPAADPATREYWLAAARGELRLPRCTRCARFHFYPRPACPHCGGLELEWATCSGYGKVYSYTIVQRPPSTAFEAPYVVAIIELDEGPHLMSNVVHVEPSSVRIGQRVRVQFGQVAEGVCIPLFAPT